MVGGHCRSGSRILGTKTNSDTRIAVTITIAITIAMTIAIAIATSAAYHVSMSLCSSTMEALYRDIYDNSVLGANTVFFVDYARCPVPRLAVARHTVRCAHVGTSDERRRRMATSPENKHRGKVSVL